jgi:hypothetical protein
MPQLQRQRRPQSAQEASTDSDRSRDGKHPVAAKTGHEAATGNTDRAAALNPAADGQAMAPPSKQSLPSPEGALKLHRWLTAHMDGGPASTHPWTFYEVVDTYLGPWGEHGYPIGYGKKYCVEFSSNEALQQSWVVQSWTGSTLVKLQEALRDYIVRQYQAGTLATLREPALRAAAFQSHPEAYVDAGLTDIFLDGDVNALLNIAAIPAAEFDPRSEDFGATIQQALKTTGMVGADITGRSLHAVMSRAASGHSLLENAALLDAEGHAKKHRGPEYTCPSCGETTRKYEVRLPSDMGGDWVCSTGCLHHMFAHD